MNSFQRKIRIPENFQTWHWRCLPVHLNVERISTQVSPHPHIGHCKGVVQSKRANTAISRAADLNVGKRAASDVNFDSKGVSNRWLQAGRRPRSDQRKIALRLGFVFSKTNPGRKALHSTKCSRCESLRSRTNDWPTTLMPRAAEFLTVIFVAMSASPVRSGEIVHERKSVIACVCGPEVENLSRPGSSQSAIRRRGYVESAHSRLWDEWS